LDALRCEEREVFGSSSAFTPLWTTPKRLSIRLLTAAFLAEGHLLNSSFHGPRWLTAGTIGPEGSVMEFVVFLLAFLLFNWVYPLKNRQIG
jgi:hypothetical protein